MKENRFKIGDKVTLNSGSPVLTVTDIYPHPYTESGPIIEVAWFDDDRFLCAFDASESCFTEAA